MVQLSTQIISFAAISALAWSATAQTCYGADGKESGDTPCVSGAGEVFCCPSGSQCISSPGPLCQATDGTFQRGSCTVQDWSSSACPRFCLAIIEANPLVRCNDTVSEGHFCCGYDFDDEKCRCKDNFNTFVLGNYTLPETNASSSSSSLSSTRTASNTKSTASATTHATTTGTASRSSASSSSASASSLSSSPSSSSAESTSTSSSITTNASTASSASAASATTTTASTGAAAALKATVGVQELLLMGAMGIAGGLL